MVEGLYGCGGCGGCIESPGVGAGGDVGGREGEEGGGCCCCCCCGCDQPLAAPDEALRSGVGVVEVVGAADTGLAPPEADGEGDVSAPDDEEEVAIQCGRYIDIRAAGGKGRKERKKKSVR